VLRYASDRRTLAFVGSFFVLVAALWCEVIPFWLQIPAYLWILGVALVGGVMTHNALHSPVFRSKKWNRVLHVLLGFIYGMPVSLFVPVHNLSHHKHSQGPKDVMRSSKLRSKWNLVNVLRAPTVMGLDTLKDDVRYFKVQKQRGAAIYRHLRVELAFLIVYAGLLIALDWKKFLLLAFLPWQLSQAFIVGINFVQHDGCDDDASGFNFARNLTGKTFNWFFFNNGFHTLHHLEPGLHWSHLRTVHAEKVAPHMHPSLAADNAAVFFWNYFFAPGTRRTYLGEPFTPGEAGADEPWFYESAETYSAS
jgi:fatty acid desaturase